MGADADIEVDVDNLLEAARYDDLDDLKSLVESGISLSSKDSQGRTALHMAAANGHLAVVEYLISQGADVNARNEEDNTPLHWACLNGHIEVLKRLILGGADPCLHNKYDKTPMDEALSTGKMETVDAVNVAMAQLELQNANVTS